MSTHAISSVGATPQRHTRHAHEAARLLVPLGRLCFVLVFLSSVPAQFSSKVIAMAAAQGVPAASLLVPVAGLISLVGGVLVLLGYHARFGAWLLVAFLVPVTLNMHAFWNVADAGMHQLQQIMFMKNVAILGGAFLIAYYGAGPVSLDAHTPRGEAAARQIGARP
jgi:putative oxidoreductase